MIAKAQDPCDWHFDFEVDGVPVHLQIDPTAKGGEGWRGDEDQDFVIIDGMLLITASEMTNPEFAKIAEHWRDAGGCELVKPLQLLENDYVKAKEAYESFILGNEPPDDDVMEDEGEGNAPLP